ncbi:MAG: hypothetical protein O6768_01700 [Planctomycetota bacterium]|nr:hypothetical protein [Planctomycetota bacterium]
MVFPPPGHATRIDPQCTAFPGRHTTYAYAWPALALASLILAGRTDAGERKFTYVYEATTMAAGEFEYEQWVTWKTDKDTDSSFDRIDFRHEIEFGVTDHLQVALYFADWRYQDGRSVSDDGAEYRGTAVELIYNLSDPWEDFLGSALYGEIKLGDELFELEGKLILQKNVNLWTAAYNATIEAEWEGAHYTDDNGKFQQTLGISYQLRPQLLVGAELLHEIKFPDWSTRDEDVLYLGPNLSYRHQNWWVTVTPLLQVTDVASEPEFQLRLIFGFDF